ncbi:acetoacetate decarboxylase family protein [Rouxiella badensis]|uniref:acetoacetate decarboxylase family protein n=1 Tax=Rouxiella badensis TaxID=1646377 RepID=UPI0022AA3B67|nr:acetoacetate decarboxylase family protein [Rouxiella badensis]WAT09667.1 acetoacetate decarboxylase family protein [Rouxiella badensis]
MRSLQKITDVTFSQPYGPAQIYHAPPYKYRNAFSINMLYTIEKNGIVDFLPPGVELADKDPVISAVVSAYPETPFGVYNEMWFYVRVKFEGKIYMYNPVIYVDSDSSMACGREMWGFPKKIAEMQMLHESGKWIFHGRKNGKPLIDVIFSPETQPGFPSMIGEISYPSLTCRIIPNRLGRGEPDIAQLITVSNPKTILKDGFGNDQRWLGAVNITLGELDPTNPVYLFQPKEVLQCWMSYYDADLPEGELLYDYKTQSSDIL